MDHQPQLFHEDIYHALRDDIAAAGGMQKVGHAIWPDLGPVKAGEKLADCTNPDRSQKLALTELLMILRMAGEAGCHIGMNFVNRGCGYSEPTWKKPEDEADELMREYIAVQKEQNQRSQRLEMVINRVKPQ